MEYGQYASKVLLEVAPDQQFTWIFAASHAGKTRAPTAWVPSAHSGTTLFNSDCVNAGWELGSDFAGLY